MSMTPFRPTLRRRDFNSVLDCLVSDRIGAGSLSRELAAELARSLGVAGGYCLATYSGAVTSALRAVGVGPGDRVVLSALAPSLHLGCLAAIGAEPLVTDVEADTGLPDLAEAELQAASGARALLLHYPLGQVPRGAELFSLGLPVVEDISQALGGSVEGQRCGALGQAAVLSLAPEGIITAGGGAAVLMRERSGLRALRSVLAPLHPESLLPDMNAALGSAQLRRLERFLSSRREIAAAYRQAISRSRHRSFPWDEEAQGVDFSFPVIVRDSLNQVRAYATKHGVETILPFADALLAVAGVGAGGLEAGQAVSPAGAFAPAAQAADPAGGESVRETGDAPAGTADLTRWPRATDLMRRCLLFPLYPALGRRDVQLAAKVLSSLP